MSYLTLTIEDANGETSDIPIEFSGGFAGDITGLVETAWGIVNPLVTGRLAGASVTLTADISGLVNAAASALADVQELAKFVFTDITGAFRKTFSIPTFDETLFVGNGSGHEVDMTETAVTAFVAMITDGFDDEGATPVEINPTTNHGEDLFALKSARQAWGKERR